jgi:flagellar biosynthetic protein FliR
MHVELTLNFSRLYGFLLALARVSGVIVFVPIPGVSAGPESSRILLALVLTIALFPVWPAPVFEGPVVGPLLVWMATEAALGLTISIAVAFLLEGVQMGAQMIGLQAGYSFASTVDPNTQADTTSLQLLAQLLAGLLFFTFGFDRQVIRILARSLQLAPAGTFGINSSIAEAITRLGSAIFVTGLQLAAPVLALLLLLDIAFAVLGRLQTQLQLLSLSFSIKMVVGLAFLTGVLSFFPSVFAKSGVATFQTLMRLFTH